MAPFFSIVVPTFNRAELLLTAIQSVLAQSIDDWELIIVDNQSSDGTKEKIRQFSDSRIKLLTTQNYGSISKSRNFGIKAALGEWIAFLDSDDWWEPNKLEICLNIINENVDFIYHDLRVDSKDSFRRDLICRKLKYPVFVDLILNGNPIATSSVVARKSLFNQINGMNESIEMVTTADYNSWLKMSLISEKFYHLPKFLGYYRFHGDNLSNDAIFRPNLLAISEFLPHLNKAQRRRAISTLNFTQARVNFLARNYGEVNSYLIASFLNSKLSHKMKSIYMLIYAFIANLKMEQRK
jgi:glycosyltransferase involved in cell wall biosynthesis